MSKISANRLEPSEIEPQPENVAQRDSESVQNLVAFRKNNRLGPPRAMRAWSIEIETIREFLMPTGLGRRGL